MIGDPRNGEGQPNLKSPVSLGTITKSAVDDLDSRSAFWTSAERHLDDLGFVMGSRDGERLRALIAAHVNPLGPADDSPIRCADASDPAFLALVDRAGNGADSLWREAHEASNQLALEQGDDVRLAHVVRFRDRFPLDIRASLLHTAWKEARHPSRFDPTEVVAAFRELGDLAFENGRPDGPLQVYRAVAPTGVVRGLAWTTQQLELRIFTRRAYIKQRAAPEPRPARVYTATIDPEGVVAVYTDENEVVVEPARLKNIQLLRLTDPESDVWEGGQGEG